MSTIELFLQLLVAFHMLLSCTCLGHSQPKIIPRYTLRVSESTAMQEQGMFANSYELQLPLNLGHPNRIMAYCIILISWNILDYLDVTTHVR